MLEIPEGNEKIHDPNKCEPRSCFLWEKQENVVICEWKRLMHGSNMCEWKRLMHGSKHGASSTYFKFFFSSFSSNF